MSEITNQNTPTPRTEAQLEKRRGQEISTSEIQLLGCYRVLETELTAAQARIKELETKFARLNKDYCEIVGGENEFVELNKQVQELTRERDDAKELLREIRDGEVNPEDEADKFLRDHIESSQATNIQRIAESEKKLKWTSYLRI